MGLGGRAAAEAPPVLVPPMLGEPGVHFIEAGQTLMDVARLYDLGYVELRAANPRLDSWSPPPGAAVILPSAHLLPGSRPVGLVVNLGDMRLYWFGDHGEIAESFPIGIGQSGLDMVEGLRRVVTKRVNPTWIPPEDIRADHPGLAAVVPPGPDNPLGAYSLELSGGGAYRIHGTNKPDGVGRRVSHGCIRLYPEDIAALFPVVPVGTKVRILDQPVKLAWVDGELLLEVHPSKTQADALEQGRALPPEPLPDLHEQVAGAAGDQTPQIDWAAVDAAAAARDGIPRPITKAPAEPP